MYIFDVVEILDRQQIAQAVERSLPAVSNAVASGKFPSSWYLVIKHLCAEKGIAVDEQLFNFRPVPGDLKTERSDDVA